MKKNVVNAAIVVCLFVAGAATLAAEQPPSAPAPANAPEPATNTLSAKIQFATPVYDFGKLIAGSSVKYEFIFTNTGEALLEIKEVRTSCGCTTAGEWSKKVEPGKTGTIPIQFNSGHFGGQVTKTVTVTSNDKEHPSVVLKIQGTIWKPVEVNPQVATLNLTSETSTDAKAVVRIINNEEQLLTLSDLQVNNPSFVVELKTNQPGKEFEVTVKMATPPATGTVQGQISLKTSSTNTPSVSFTATASVQPVIATTPPQVNLPAAPLSQKVSQTVSIRNNGTNMVALSDAAVNAEGVDVQLKETEPGRSFMIALTFPAGFEITEGKTVELSVKSNHPQFPVIRVPIHQTRSAAAAPPAVPATKTVQITPPATK